MYNGNSGQDWKDVVFGGGGSMKNVKESKPHYQKSQLSKLAEENQQLPFLNKESRDMLTRYRCNAKMSQQDLAKRIATKVDLIKDLENGRKIPVDVSGTLLGKVKGVFPGLNIKYVH
jgi:ribosome-binding protein aMBF1 (putative translation factor)